MPQIERLDEGDQVVAEVMPVGAAVGLGRETRSPVAALVDGEDAEVRRQGLENAAVGKGVEAVGMQEDEVDRSFGRAEVEGREGAFAAAGKCDGTVAERGYFLSGAPVASWIRAAMRSVESAAWPNM